MAKLTFKNEQKTEARAAYNGRYDVLQPGKHLGVIQKTELATFEAGGRKLAKLVPEIRVYRSGKDATRDTVRLNPDVMLGAIEDGQLVKWNDDSKSAMWSEGRFFLGSLGLLSEEGELNIDTDHIQGFLIMVRTEVGGYIKGTENFREQAELLKELDAPEDLDTSLHYTGGVRQLGDLDWRVLAYNLEYGYSKGALNGEEVTAEQLKGHNNPRQFYATLIKEGEIETLNENVRLVTINVASGFFAPNPKDLHEGHYHDEDTGASFVSPEDYNKFASATGAAHASW